MRKWQGLMWCCTALAAACAIVGLQSTTVHGDGGAQPVLIKCTQSCANVAAFVAAVGGKLSHQYENVEALAAEVPADSVARLAAFVGGDAIRKDVKVAPPRPASVVSINTAEIVGARPLATVADVQKLTRSLPANYNYNNGLTGAASLHAQASIGSNVIVAVIDSGTANADVVPALQGSVIGGETFVPAIGPDADPVLSATSRLNGNHGTWVGSMIAGHAAFLFTPDSVLVRSLLIHSPESVGTCPLPMSGPPACAVPMIGTAPGASIYALKVFPSNGNSAPESRIIAAMDRAITLRRNFNKGLSTAPVSGDGSENNPFVYNALKIQVVSMSLGGPTLFAGQDLEDQLTVKMLEVGMMLSASAGNDGIAAMTSGSPSTGLGGLAVGAANTPVHERVLGDVAFGLGIGVLLRPTTHIQTAAFSSRGPTADGRFDPDITANGFASYAQGADGGIFLVSGTSLSSPTAAGAAALLRGAMPSATAVQVRNALERSANPSLLGDGSTRIDQGKGFLDIPAALALLRAGAASSKLAKSPRHGEHDDGDDEVGAGGKSVAQNIRRLGFETVRFTANTFSTQIDNLLPGQVAQLFVPSDARTMQFIVSVTNVTPELPPDGQNQLFGDNVLVNVIDAPTSTAVVRTAEFVVADTSFVIDNPQTGLVRVAVQGASINAGRISTTVTITRQRRGDGRATLIGTLAQNDIVPIKFNVPEGAAQGVFEVSWKQNWGRYPTNDIDMVLVDPLGVVDETGGTINSPERVVVANPAAGTWTAYIVGFTINDPHDCDDDDDESRWHWRRHRHRHGNDEDEVRETFTFRALADGVRLRAIR